MRRRTPIAEQRRLVTQWRASGQSLSAFSEAAGIAQSTFSKWARKHNVAPTDSTTAIATAPPAFVELAAVVAPPRAHIRLCVDGHLAAALTFEALPAPEWFAAVLRGVTSC